MYLKGSGGQGSGFVTIRNSENLYHKVCPFSIIHHDTVLFIQFALCAFGKFQAERFHGFRVKNGRGIAPPKCFKSGGDFHPTDRFSCHHSEDENRSPVHFYTPITRTIVCPIEIIIEFCHRFVEIEFRRNCPHDVKELREVRLPRLNVS